MDENAPQRPIPPAPPRPEWVKPASAPTTTAPAPVAGPIIDFFQRRLESMERELALERERAQSAQSLLDRQQSLKNEVDDHLRAITDQLKKEKTERETGEAREHARGRIEALEKRLDEMNATFAQLLKEAVAKREGESGPSAAAMEAELAALRGTLKDGLDSIARWRTELKDLSALAPRIRDLSENLPRDEKTFEDSVGRRLDEFARAMSRALDEWKGAQAAERAELDRRLEASSRERVDLGRAWETQTRALREEQFKERVAREVEVSRQIQALDGRISSLASGQEGAEKAFGAVREALERLASMMSAGPRDRDAEVSALRAENEELGRLLAARQDALRKLAEERHGVETSLSDRIVALTGQLEDERARTREAQAESGRRQGEIEALNALRIERERAVSERDAQIRRLEAQHHEIVQLLATEAEKVRAGLERLREADASAEARLAELRKRLDEETERRGFAEGAAADARRQMTAMSEQAARALQERDSVVARHADWDKERRELLEQIRRKDEMIAVLSTTFRGALKKSA